MIDFISLHDIGVIVYGLFCYWMGLQIGSVGRIEP